MHLITDPQLAAAWAAFEQALPGGISLEDIPAARQLVSGLAQAMAAQAPEIPQVVTSDHHAPGPEGAPDVLVRLYRPRDRPGPLPAMLWMHAGGYVVGSVEQDDLKAKGMALALDCTIASVEYRLAPEHVFPSALHDCHAALEWLAANAEPQNIRRDKIAIGGSSAGAGLAAGLGLLARDRGKVDVAYQMLIYPMLDDTNVEQAGPDVPDTALWTRANNLIGWRAYLGQEPGGEDVSPYAAPSRARDLDGLPPTYVGVGTVDLFRDEDIAYAQRLMQAGIPTDLRVYADGFHAFDAIAADTVTAQQFVSEQMRLVKRALHER